MLSRLVPIVKPPHQAEEGGMGPVVAHGEVRCMYTRGVHESIHSRQKAEKNYKGNNHRSMSLRSIALQNFSTTFRDLQNSPSAFPLEDQALQPQTNRREVKRQKKRDKLNQLCTLVPAH